MSGTDPGWASPGGSPEEPPRFGERAPQPAVPPGASVPPNGYGPPPSAGIPPGAVGPMRPGLPGWTPPPRPGLIPLHPLGFGQLLGIAFATIRWNPRATILPAVLISIVQAAVLYGLGLFVVLPGAERIPFASAADQGTILAGVIAEGSGVVVLSLALSIIGTALLEAVVITVVAEGALGRKPGPGAVLRAAGKRIWPLAGFAGLVLLVEIVVIGIVAGIVVAVATLGGLAIVFAVLAGVLGAIGLVVLGAFLAVQLGTVPSAIVLEHLGLRAAVVRAWILTRGTFWRTFGLVILIVLIVGFAAQVVSLPVSLVGGALAGLLEPNLPTSGPLQAVTTSLYTSLPASIVGVVVGGVGQIAQVAAFALVYLDQRMRREGLDLELQRAAETPGGPDPFTAAL